MTRSHYLLNDRLLARLDRAGIMVWNQAPIWQRDRRANLLALPASSARARLGDGAPDRDRRAQPPVGDHPLGGQRAVVAPRRPARHVTRLYLDGAQQLRARRSTRRCPISVDIKGRPATTPSSSPTTSSTCSGSTSTSAGTAGSRTSTTCRSFLHEMRDLYPRHGARDDRVRRRGAARAGGRAGRPEGQLRLPDLPPASARSTWSTRPRSVGRDLLDAARVRDLSRAGPAAPGSARPSSGPTPATTRGCSPTRARRSRPGTSRATASRPRRCIRSVWPGPEAADHWACEPSSRNRRPRARRAARRCAPAARPGRREARGRVARRAGGDRAGGAKRGGGGRGGGRRAGRRQGALEVQERRPGLEDGSAP